jgi:hypothetical protein
VSSIIRHPKDFWAGLLFIAFGGGAVLISSEYPMGTAGRMGPGYFPTVLGWLLVLIGVITAGRSFFVKGEPIGKLVIREIAIVMSAVVLFGFTVRDAGLVPAVFILVLLSSYASSKFRLVPMLGMAAGSAVFCWIAFVYLLGLPLQAFGPWFGF